MGVWEGLDLFLPFLDSQKNLCNTVSTSSSRWRGREEEEQSRRKEKAKLAKFSFLHTLKFILK